MHVTHGSGVAARCLLDFSSSSSSRHFNALHVRCSWMFQCDKTHDLERLDGQTQRGLLVEALMLDLYTQFNCISNYLYMDRENSLLSMCSIGR